MQIDIRINLPETIEFESVREYILETLIEFQTDTAKEFEVPKEQITFDFDIE